MGWIIVIEENPAIASEIEEALAQIDSKLTLVRFAKSGDFLNWMEQLQAHDPEVIAALPKDDFLGLITAVDTWKFKDVRLIGKFKTLFVQKKMAEKEDDLFIVFTGYESPGFQKKRFEYKSVHNFIFKPFDKLLLKQMLEIAIKGRQPTKTHYTHVYKTNLKIEMLKEIEISQVGELSFKTKTDQLIQTGTIAKYYADFLETKQHRSALAQVIKVDMPNVTLRFFALDQTQSFNLQKLAQEHRKTVTLPGLKGNVDDYQFIFVKHPSSTLAEELQPSFERFYENASVSLSTLDELHKLLKTSSTKKPFVFIDHAHIAGNEVADLDALHKFHPALGIFVLCPRILSEALETELSLRVEDIFYAPFNRSYIVKGLKLRFLDLVNKEELFESVHDVEKGIHVSNPVQISEVSESGLVLTYRRALDVGCFREFVLWRPEEINVPTLLAQCNYTEKSTDGKSFNCHFTFFGLTDHELKFVRRWMLLSYVDEKQKGQD